MQVLKKKKKKKKTPLIWEAEMEFLPENMFSFLIYNP